MASSTNIHRPLPSLRMFTSLLHLNWYLSSSYLISFYILSLLLICATQPKILHNHSLIHSATHTILSGHICNASAEVCTNLGTGGADCSDPGWSLGCTRWRDLHLPLADMMCAHIKDKCHLLICETLHLLVLVLKSVGDDEEGGGARGHGER